MSYRIFLAGAAGAIGKRLTPLLVEAGHHVMGTTRSEDKSEVIRALGAEPVLVDVFDAKALEEAVIAARPHIVIHQLTDLPPALDPAQMAASLPRNARIREEGTRNLIAAARAANPRRIIAQSVAWMYAPGPTPHGEDDPLDVAAEGSRAVTMRGVLALERSILSSPPLEGIVLRYGQFYGPGTGSDDRRGSAPVHVDAAAYAALLARDHGSPGIFNIAERNTEVQTEKAQTELG